MTRTVNRPTDEGPERLAPSMLAAFKALVDATSAVSDVLDALGTFGAIPAARLRPTLDGVSIVGQAVTIRNVPLRDVPHVAARRAPQLDVVSVHDVAGDGDILVIEGVPDCSNFGGMAALLAKQRGRSGAVIAGGARDISQCRQAGFPMWVSAFTPISGKNRVRTVAINGEVTVEGVTVRPGDLVVADSTGVCFVPFGQAEEVARKLAEVKTQEDADEASIRNIRPNDQS